MVEESIDIAAAVSSGCLAINGRAENTLFPERIFTTANRLITVDAPDGSGKGAVAFAIQQQLASIYGPDNVFLVRPNRFDQSLPAREMEKKLRRQPGLSSSSARHNSHFMAGLMLNYRTVVSPALEAGKIVVVDSSEIRSLAYILDRGTPDAVKSTLRWIKSGRATSGILAGNRVFIKVTPEDCLANIEARGKRDYGDPANLQEAQKRAKCYELSVQVHQGLKQDSLPNWIIIDNQRIKFEDKKSLTHHLNQLVADKIIPCLHL